MLIRGQRTDESRPRFPLSACIDPVFPDRCTLLLYHGIPLSETDKHHGYDREEHKNEPVRELGRWCGPVGIMSS